MFDAREVESNEEPFKFVGLDGTEHEMPNMRSLTGWQAQRIQAGDISALVHEGVLTKEVHAAIMDLPLGVQEKLGRAWSEHGGEAGKASSQSSLPQSIGKRSKRT